MTVPPHALVAKFETQDWFNLETYSYLSFGVLTFQVNIYKKLIMDHFPDQNWKWSKFGFYGNYAHGK